MAREITYPPQTSGSGGGGGSSFAHLLNNALVYPSAVYFDSLGAGVLHAVAIDVPSACTLQAIRFMTGASSTGNYRMGIYGPSAVYDTADGAALVVDSGTVAMPSTFSRKDQAFSDVALEAGRYWVVMQFSSGSSSFARAVEEVGADGHQIAYAAGAFGALPATLPTMSYDDNIAPFLQLKVTPA